MSHIVVIQTKVRDASAVSAACGRLQLPPPIRGTHRLFSDEVIGLGVQLPDWRYPLVAQLETGELRFDNYNGRWGAQKHLDRFLQTYAVEMVKSQARRQGHAVTEQSLADGSIKLSIGVS